LKLYDTKLERYDVKRCLAESNLVQGDLLQILAQWKEDEETSTLRKKIAIGCLELLTELTWPFELDAERTTVNHHRHLPYLQLAQIEYKRAILQFEGIDILHKTIAAAVPALSTQRRERNSRDEGIINLLLYFFRNIVLIDQPAHLPTNGDENDFSRAATLEAFHNQDVFQLLLTICSGMGDDFQDQDIIIMEILFHLVKGVDPKKIFREEKQVASDNLKNFKSLLQKEKAMFAAQARNAPTRHNRFGTMIWVKRPDEKVTTLSGQGAMSSEKVLQKMDSTKKWNKPKSRSRKVERPGESNDFVQVHLDARARKHLKTFVGDFIDSSFNPLFNHLRRAIERETDRVKESHSRQFFYLVSWFLKADEARRENNAQSKDSSQSAEDTPFAYIASVLTQENFVLLGRTMQRQLEDKSWHDLHTSMMAFTQIMLTVSAMADSKSEDDQEIAENIQSRIFYEEQTHDRVLQIVRSYKEGTQSFGYLDACTDMAHVFLRMLERYSKVNVDMYIRSKRRARRKAKAKPKGQATIEGLDEDQPQHEESGERDEADASREVQERKFDFNRFSARFVTESCIDTFVALAHHYATINEDQLKRCHRFFYRAAFKMERAILLFRVDILNLFNRMIQGPDGLDTWLDRKNPQFKEWEELIKQIFRRCIKKLEDRPEMIVEMLFTKIPNTLFYLENGYDVEVKKAVPRAPAELEVKPGMTYEEQIGVAVSALLNQGKLDSVAWVKTVLEKASEERRSWEYQQSALVSLERPAEDPAQPTESDADRETPAAPAEDDRPKAPSIVVVPDNDERKTATFKDKHLRLLLKTLSFQRLGMTDDPDASWTVPSNLTADQLEESLDLIRKFEFDLPVYEEGKSAETFIRNASAARRNAYAKEGSDSDGDSEIDESLFVPGGPTMRDVDNPEDRPRKKRTLKRKGGEITEEERRRRADDKKKREREKDAKVKSTLFVTESDDEDDDDRDAEFFRIEAARRGKAVGAIKEALMQGRTGHGEDVAEDTRPASNKRKSVGNAEKTSKRRKTIDLDDDDDMSDIADEPLIVNDRGSSEDQESEREESSDAEQDPEETPHSSQSKEAPAEKTPVVLSETSGNKGPFQLDSDDEEDDVPVIKSMRRRSGRAPIVIEDDDSE